ncbi:MAG: SpoIIE family protein phosphatase [Paludibacteraceae bacterium]|nr:SpoIIE family protein phosphatase [Paludibacteraceae bacterium]
MKNKGSHFGLWVILIAAIVLESISCIQYFYSHAYLRKEAEQRAQSELRKAELEIEKHTVEMEAAAKTLAMLAEKHVNVPDSIYAATRSLVRALENTSSVAVAYVPGYFRKEGTYFEACSSRINGDSIYTRQIGSAEHDYTKMEWYVNGFQSDGCAWSEPYLDDSGSQTWVVSCSHPVKNSRGEVVAVVCVDLALDYLQRVSEYLRIYEDSYYSIRSSSGQEIVSGADTVPGRKYQIYDRDIEATGWKISIIIPEDVIFADLKRVGLIVLILMIFGLALLVFIVWLAGYNAKRLIQSLEKNQRMESELQIANTIQNAMLPKVFPPFTDRLDLNVCGMVNPAKEVGGDLYDFYVRHDKLFFCVGDVSGKGVPASLVMAMTRSLFRNITAHDEQPAIIMRKMNRALADQNAQNMFLTLFLGVLDCQTGQLDFCNAGHNAPVQLTSCGLLPVVANLPLGIDPDFEFQAQSTQIAYNEVLFLYTDGLTEAENDRHEQYGEERMLQMLGGMADNTPRYIIRKMQEDVEAFVDGAQQSDDLTMLAIRYQMPAIVMRNDIQQIPTLAEWVEGLGIPAELNMPVNLALEEIVSNVMLYAYPKERNGQVFVEFSRFESKGQSGPSRLIFVVSDSGIAFDPTQREEVDISLAAEDRDIGGLGIHMVRKLMDEIRYERADNKNILTLVKELKN